MSESQQLSELSLALYLTQCHSWDDSLHTMTNMWEMFEDSCEGQPVHFARVNPDVVIHRPRLYDDGSLDLTYAGGDECFIPIVPGDYARGRGGAYQQDSWHYGSRWF